MNQRSILFFFFAAVSLLSWATDEEIVLNHPGQQHDHIEYYLPADAPQAFYDPDDMEIIIVANGVALYYDVEIISQKTNHSVLYTKISGYGDIIDVSYLPEAYYRIVIHSSSNNVFEGYFKKTESSSLKNPFYHRRK